VADTIELGLLFSARDTPSEWNLITGMS